MAEVVNIKALGVVNEEAFWQAMDAAKSELWHVACRMSSLEGLMDLGEPDTIHSKCLVAEDIDILKSALFKVCDVLGIE